MALAEAAERFSIQFCSDLPAMLRPIRTVGGEDAPLAAVDLTIGAPGRRNDSTGAAAGGDLDDATARAALEVLERLHLAALRDGARELQPVDPAGFARLRRHAVWAAGQLRRLDCRAGAFDGYSAAACACTDLDGGRRTEGSAARPGMEAAVLAAVEEAMFHWRNMVEIERQSPDISTMAPEDREAIARYRGAAPRRDWPPAETARAGRSRGRADVSGLLDALARRSGQRVRVFDLTAPEVGVPVVKAVLG